jgi:hypothetical protein
VEIDLEAFHLAAGKVASLEEEIQLGLGEGREKAYSGAVRLPCVAGEMACWAASVLLVPAVQVQAY